VQADAAIDRDPGGNSRIVTSNQPTVHRDLEPVVRRHANFPYRRPVAAHNRTQFARLDSIVVAHGGPLILDSGCGNGESTLSLARHYPHHLVIGIDKSRTRSARAGTAGSAENLRIAWGDCIDLWRLACDAEWPVERHYLLYPNPWPKAKHLQRRWHGHPVFSTLVALGGLLELRSNWQIYVEEFALALATVDAGRAKVETLDPLKPMTSFERKYLTSGHILYRLSARLGSRRSIIVERQKVLRDQGLRDFIAIEADDDLVTDIDDRDDP
jgi:tRNA (guanine-N7-)-methyltransferase